MRSVAIAASKSQHLTIRYRDSHYFYNRQFYAASQIIRETRRATFSSQPNLFRAQHRLCRIGFLGCTNYYRIHFTWPGSLLSRGAVCRNNFYRFPWEPRVAFADAAHALREFCRHRNPRTPRQGFDFFSSRFTTEIFSLASRQRNIFIVACNRLYRLCRRVRQHVVLSRTRHFEFAQRRACAGRRRGVLDFECRDRHVVIGSQIHRNPFFASRHIRTAFRAPHNFTSPNCSCKT
jgi:hypothetical protein